MSWRIRDTPEERYPFSGDTSAGRTTLTGEGLSCFACSARRSVSAPCVRVWPCSVLIVDMIYDCVHEPERSLGRIALRPPRRHPPPASSRARSRSSRDGPAASCPRGRRRGRVGRMLGRKMRRKSKGRQVLFSSFHFRVSSVSVTRFSVSHYTDSNYDCK